MANTKELARRGILSDRQMKRLDRDDDESREHEDVCKLLQMSVADTIDLWAQSKHAHWNVTGPSFIGAHELLDDVAEHIEGIADQFAERLRQLNDAADGRLTSVVKTSAIEPLQQSGPADQKVYLMAIASRLEQTCARFERAIDECEDAGDKVTANIFTDAAQDVDQLHYLLISHCSGKN